MSSSRTVKYTCPYCGKEFDIEVYDLVHAEKDPDLRDRCISGDIFRHSCPHCKTDFMVQAPLVYVDEPNKFVIWLSTQPVNETLRKLAETLDRQKYRLRRCETVQEFTEKIEILEDGIDDVMVELAKYDCFIEFTDNKKGNPEDITSIEYQRVENGVMKINVRTGDKGMSFLIPVSMMEAEMEENSELYETDNASFPCINRNWIIDLFTESAGEA
ncbi:MAG: CpXC domain-containing protein [Solobacterium sp.]|nr:CpXC domain-containing protein [Solobacterium sp.]